MLFYEAQELVYILILACLWDYFFGEMPTKIHPVVWMGKIIDVLSKRRPRSVIAQLIWGGFITTFVISVFYLLSHFILDYFESQKIVYMAISVFLFKASFAIKALKDAAFEVEKKIQNASYDEARDSMKALCSRNRTSMSVDQMRTTASASIAENYVDSIAAPILFFILTGVPGALAYRVANTLDAMLGYKDDRIHIGYISAKLDDVLNYLPARISTYYIFIAAFLKGYSLKRAYKIFKNERSATPSPNGGWPMAAIAGILDLRIEKPESYCINERGSPSSPSSIEETWSIISGASIIAIASWIVLLLIFG